SLSLTFDQFQPIYEFIKAGACQHSRERDGCLSLIQAKNVAPHADRKFRQGQPRRVSRSGSLRLIISSFFLDNADFSYRNARFAPFTHHPIAVGRDSAHFRGLRKLVYTTGRSLTDIADSGSLPSVLGFTRDF